MKCNKILSYGISFFLLLLFMSVTSCRHTASQQEHTLSAFMAQVTFNDSVHDFGTFSSDSAVKRYTFNFVNTGNVPAVILNIDPSCRCISATYTQEVVQPGKSGRIEVIFDGTQSFTGYFNKSIRVRINSSYIYILKVKGCMK